ncbi:MAG TPA: nucleotide exchange factor GrpE [Candidatus Binatia bacterium]|jgi:molecular chaperone GrpE
MSQDDVNDEKAEGTATTQEQAEGAASAPESEIEPLRQKLAEKEDEARVNHDRFLRERAELENFKKRMLREKAEALRFASEPLIRDLIPVIDNLERALECGEGDGKSVIEGVGMVVKSLLEILDRHGVKRIEALGQPFDPAHHQAMSQVESAEHEPNQVVEQHHTGYLLYDRLLRPALVTVSTRKSQDTVESEQKRD